MVDYADQIAPVNHSGLSKTVNVAAGAGVGAAGKWFKWGSSTFLGCVVLGGLIGALAPAIGAIGVSSAVLWGLGIGTGVGIFAAPVAGGFGALVGGVTGGAKASHQVKLEKAAAQSMDMQLEAYKYNAMAQAAAANQGTVVNAPSATNIIPQGSAMNMASPQIQTSGLQYDGPVASQQLAAAR